MSGYNKVSAGSISGAKKYAVANEIIVITGTEISIIGDIIFFFFFDNNVLNSKRFLLNLTKLMTSVIYIVKIYACKN
jgi:hypothetical protein